MGLKTNAYATIWEVRERNGRTEAKISTSRRNRDTGSYETDWSDWMTLYGDAAQLASAPARTRIRIGDFDVTNKYDKEKKKMYTNYRLYSYADANSPAQPATPAAGITPQTESDPF